MALVCHLTAPGEVSRLGISGCGYPAGRGPSIRSGAKARVGGLDGLPAIAVPRLGGGRPDQGAVL